MAASKHSRAMITVSAKPRPDLEAEVEAWDEGRFAKDSWEDAPEAVPARAESVAISIRLPAAMLDVLRAFAARSGVGYQVLMKTWLHERIAAERAELAARARSRRAPTPERMVDSENIDGPHYRMTG